MKKTRILRKELSELVAHKVIEKAPSNVPLFENHIFCISKPSGKIRVIFDMKFLNTFIRLPKLKMFTFDKGYQSFLLNSFACRIDLSNAFWHIGVNDKYMRFLSFNFENVSYCWKAMPFGLRTAPYLFCKLMGTFTKHIRQLFRVPIFFYMDDIIVLGPSVDITQEYVNLVVSELQKAGFTINFDKSCLEPMSLITFLGININLHLKTFEPSSENVFSCITKAKAFIKRSHSSLKTFQSLLGSLNFVATFIRFGRLHLAPLHRFVPYFSNTLRNRIPAQLKSLLKFWTLPESYVSVPIPNFVRPAISIHSDASLQGWGAQITWSDGNSSYSQGSWSADCTQAHINIKELSAVWLTISSAPYAFQGHLINVFSDNKATVTWLNKESSVRSEAARSLLRDFTHLKLSYDILIKAWYVKGCKNLTADALSRSALSLSELVLNPTTFAHICSLAKISPEVDLFANSENRKCKKFFSASADPSSLGIDALAHSWDDFHVVYAFPPSHLINRTIYKFFKSRCHNILLLVPRLSTLWHKNIRRLSPIIIPYQFGLQDFQIQSTTKLVPNHCDMVAYLL